jgi:hypothetical protein
MRISSFRLCDKSGVNHRDASEPRNSFLEEQGDASVAFRNMPRLSKWNWLLAPLGFGISYRLALWLYWLPERQRWIAAHGGDANSVAFGEGEMDGTAIILMFTLLVLFVICSVFAPKARAAETIVIGGLTAVITAVCQRLFSSVLASKLGPDATFYGIPIIVACVFIFALSYFRRRRLTAGSPADETTARG